MIILSPYEYFILKSSLENFRSEDCDSDGDPIVDVLLGLNTKLFGSNSEGSSDGSESVPPSVVMGPLAWAYEPSVHLSLCSGSVQYKKTSNERYRKKVLAGL